jgi:O-antigen ligase
MTALPPVPAFDRARSLAIADALAVALAATLPWSTSLTAILVAAWAIALVPTLDRKELRAVLLTAAGGLPVLLVLLGMAGTLWADVSWGERWGGLGSFLKLLAIPLLVVQFRRSARGETVFIAYLAGCVPLLLASYALVLWPDLPHSSVDGGVLVKNASSQSGEFAICIGGLICLAHRAILRGQALMAAACGVLMLAMLADIVFVATGRTALVVVVALVGTYAATRLSARGVLAVTLAAAALAGIAWFSSPFLRARVEQIWTDAQRYEQSDARNSSGERLDFYKKSLAIIRTAPVLGHGTGSITAEFRKASDGMTGWQAVPTTNPHQQTFAVGIQLGFLGIGVLWAMWLAHLALFRGAGLAAWVGLLIVVQNVVGSTVNSHLFDFLQGWTYVVGVGVAGGMVLKACDGTSA